MSEEWLTDAEAEKLFRSLRPMSIGKAQAEVRAARASSEVRKEPVDDLVLNDDGLLGMDLRPGSHGAPVLSSTNRPTQGDLPRLSKDDLLYWFNQRHQVSEPKPTRRSREQVDRDAAKRVINILYPSLPDARKLPNKKLHAEVNGWLKANGEKLLSLDTVRRAAEEIRANAAKAANALR